MKASVASTIYWLAFALLAARMLLFVDAHAVDLLFNDQWSYLTTSLYPHNLIEGFLTRLGPHRIGLGFPFFKFSLAISDYSSRSISFMVCAFAIVNALIFSFLKVKRIGPLRLTDLYIPLVFFTLNQYAIFLNNPNISIHQLTFTALLALVWLFSGSSKVWKIVLSALLMPLLAFTGNGFFLAAAFAVFSSIMFFKNRSSQRFWWLAPIVSAGLALAAYLQTANYKALDCAGIPMETPIYYLSFVKGLVLNGLVISYPGGIFKWGLFVILILLGSWVTFRILRYARQAKEMVPLLIVGYVVLFFAATLMGRWCYGPLITESSRYVPQAALAFMAFGLFSPGIKTWRTAAWGFFLSVSFIFAEYKFYQWRMPVVERFTENMRAWKECYRTTGNAKECNLEEQFQPYPGDIGPIKLQEKLERLEELNPSYR